MSDYDDNIQDIEDDDEVDMLTDINRLNTLKSGGPSLGLKKMASQRIEKTKFDSLGIKNN